MDNRSRSLLAGLVRILRSLVVRCAEVVDAHWTASAALSESAGQRNAQMTARLGRPRLSVPVAEEADFRLRGQVRIDGDGLEQEHRRPAPE